MKPLFVILISYRRLEYLKQTVASLMPSLPSGSKVVIYDNYSPEPEVQEYLRSIASEQCEIVLADKNEGWGIAMNETLRLYPEWREYDYVLESNNDVTYKPDWFAEATEYMDNYHEIGILGLWKHPHHGVRQEYSDGKLLIKDNMPAVAWLFRPKDLETFLPFPERGPTKTRGGNGEDSEMVEKIQSMGFWVCGLKEDLAEHMDGVDPKAGQDNENY